MPVKLFILTLWSLCVFGVTAHARETSLEYSRVEIKPGTRLGFEAYTAADPLRPKIREDFVITVLDRWINGVSFSYEMEQKVIGTEQGIQTLSSLDDCTGIDPWWEPMVTDYDDRCELWISAKVFRELKATRKSWLNVDTLVRSDTTVRWEFVGEEHFLCKIRGVPALLRAFRAKTNRGDDVVILDDGDNPLILSIESVYFSWKLVSID